MNQQDVSAVLDHMGPLDTGRVVGTGEASDLIRLAIEGRVSPDELCWHLAGLTDRQRDELRIEHGIEASGKFSDFDLPPHLGFQASNPNHDARGRFASYGAASAAADKASGKAHQNSDDAKETDRRDFVESAMSHAAEAAKLGDHEAAEHILRNAAGHLKSQIEEHATARESHREAAAVHREAARMAPDEAKKTEHRDTAAEHMDIAREHHEEIGSLRETMSTLKTAHGQSKDEAIAGRAQRAARKATSEAFASTKTANDSKSIELHYAAAGAHDRAMMLNETAARQLKKLGGEFGKHEASMATTHDRLAGEHRAAAESLIKGGVRARDDVATLIAGRDVQDIDALLDIEAANPNHDARGRFASYDDASAAAEASSKRAEGRSDDAREKDRSNFAHSALTHAAEASKIGDHAAAMSVLVPAAQHMRAQTEEHRAARDAHREAAAVHREAARLAVGETGRAVHRQAERDHRDEADAHHEAAKDAKSLHTEVKEAYAKAKADRAA